jgi:hypothetical protein
VIEAGRLDDAFVDATCEPPDVFTYGGMLAHVLTFAAHRRMLVLGALYSAGSPTSAPVTRCAGSPTPPDATRVAVSSVRSAGVSGCAACARPRQCR